MNDVLQELQNLVASDELGKWVSAVVILVLGWLVGRAARQAFRRLLTERLHAQQLMLGSKIVYYGVLGVAVVTAVQQLQLADLSIFLGAAGILTLALGFAAQTSASNLISGLFLVGEQSFKVGDLLQIGTQQAYVVSIDLLSVKLRTFNNVLIRIPNETLLKAEITNLTHYPIRRLDLNIPVAYKEKLDDVRKILFEVAERNPFALDEPKPLFFFKEYADSAILVRFSVWFTQEGFWESQNRIQQQIYEALSAAGIEIPFPHRTLYTGSVTEPFPFRVLDGEDKGTESADAAASFEGPVSPEPTPAPHQPPA